MDEYIEEIKKVGAKKWYEEHPRCKKEVKYLMKKYSTAYYEGKALIPDEDFDVLADVIRLINPNDKYLTTPGWGYKIKRGIKHIYGKIGTLPYYYDYNEVKNIFSKQEELIIIPKFDGINFVTYFKNGRFYKCATRGNGSVGKNISWAFNSQIDLPVELKDKSFAINGEVIYYDTPKENTNFRDIVACYLSKKKKIDENIKFMPFGLLNTQYSGNYFLQIEEINKLTYPNITYKKYKELPTKQILEQLFYEYKQLYQIDGLVITNKDKSKQIAYKFKGESL